MSFGLAALLRLLGFLPERLHRAVLRIGHKLRFALHRRFGFVQVSSITIAINTRNEVLLVRHGYVEPENWMLPGGSIGRREDPLAAASREMHEEVQCSLAGPTLFEFEEAEYWGCRYDTYLVVAVIDDEPIPDGREVVEACFHPIDQLPENMQPISRERLDRWIKAFGFDRNWRERRRLAEERERAGQEKQEVGFPRRWAPRSTASGSPSNGSSGPLR